MVDWRKPSMIKHWHLMLWEWKQARTRDVGVQGLSDHMAFTFTYIQIYIYTVRGQIKGIKCLSKSLSHQDPPKQPQCSLADTSSFQNWTGRMLFWWWWWEVQSNMQASKISHTVCVQLVWDLETVKGHSIWVTSFKPPSTIWICYVSPLVYSRIYFNLLHTNPQNHFIQILCFCAVNHVKIVVGCIKTHVFISCFLVASLLTATTTQHCLSGFWNYTPLDAKLWKWLMSFCTFRHHYWLGCHWLSEHFESCFCSKCTKTSLLWNQVTLLVGLHHHIALKQL